MAVRIDVCFHDRCWLVTAQCTVLAHWAAHRVVTQGANACVRSESENYRGFCKLTQLELEHKWQSSTDADPWNSLRLHSVALHLAGDSYCKQARNQHLVCFVNFSH